MTEGIRNALRASCEACDKEVVYEKDEDNGLDSIEVEPFVWKQLCEDCAEEYHERERRYREEDVQEGELVTFERPEL
jgi:hypothetical protein